MSTGRKATLDEVERVFEEIQRLDSLLYSAGGRQSAVRRKVETFLHRVNYHGDVMSRIVNAAWQLEDKIR